MLNNVDRIGTVLVTDELPAYRWPDAERQSGVGVFHWFSIKHTDRYLHETSFRWDARRLAETRSVCGWDTDTRLADLLTRSNRRRRSRSAGRNAEGRFEGRLRWKDLTA